MQYLSLKRRILSQLIRSMCRSVIQETSGNPVCNDVFTLLKLKVQSQWKSLLIHVYAILVYITKRCEHFVCKNKAHGVGSKGGVGGGGGGGAGELPSPTLRLDCRITSLYRPIPTHFWHLPTHMRFILQQ